MAARTLLAGSALLLTLATATGCGSRDQRAAAAAGAAADALASGNIPAASAQIGRALAQRDDVSDYWLLSARIALASGNYPGAFSAYESALTLDNGNVEALTRLCQLAVSGGEPDRAEHYADELATLRPDDPAAINVEAAIALERGDKAAATRLIGQVLAANPADPTALITRSRMLSGDGDYAGAAKAAEASLAAPGDPVGRLTLLEQAYRKAGDAAGYRRTIARLARASTDSASAQLDYAQTLYEGGDRTGGLAITRQVLQSHPGDVAIADAVLNLWQAQGATAVTPAAIAAADGPAETRATYAAFANSIGQPQLALRALGDAGAADPPGIAVNGAKAARAQALALLGRGQAANAILSGVLAVDPDQPRALAVRGRLRAQAGDRRGAEEDLRHALAAAPADATTRLALASLQQGDGDGVLAAQTLRDGIDDPDARPDPRLPARLAQMLRAGGDAASATAVITDWTRAHPFSPKPAS